MKLEVGMYVRTDDGLVRRLDRVSERTGNGIVDYGDWILRFTTNKRKSKKYGSELIVKASHNIIDLIEVGDYVNGVEVMEVDLEEKPYLKFVHGISTTDVGLIAYMGDSKLYGIKSIVTKEQFQKMEYRIGE